MLKIVINVLALTRHASGVVPHQRQFHFILTAGLVKKYSQVLQRYYVQYLKGYDQSELTQVCYIPSLSLWKVFSGLNFKK